MLPARLANIEPRSENFHFLWNCLSSKDPLQPFA